jgi:hypothetical protein
MIYKATCFDHLGGHHQAWVQDIIEDTVFTIVPQLLNHIVFTMVPQLVMP